jgi:hypothetical protein
VKTLASTLAGPARRPLPGSVPELVKVIDALTDPVAHSGRAKDGLDLALPSMRGYGFLDRPTFVEPRHAGQLAGGSRLTASAEGTDGGLDLSGQRAGS